MQEADFVSSPLFSEILMELKSINQALDEPAIRVLLSHFADYTQHLSQYECFDENTYKRNRIFRSEWVDILLLCWRPSQRTPIHDHAGSTCGVYVVRGEGTEVGFSPTQVDLLVPSYVHTLHRGVTLVNCDREAHLIGNFHSPQEDFVTLHCYSPPLSNFRVYHQSETFLANYEDVVTRAVDNACYHNPS